MRAARIGERVRALRVAAGLTQTDLAGGRFSKEYVSQIERGKTRPTADTLDWLAEKLGVDPDYLGVRRQLRGPRSRRGGARPRGGAVRDPPLRRGAGRVRRRPGGRRAAGCAGPRASLAARRVVGADPGRAQQRGPRAARPGSRARRLARCSPTSTAPPCCSGSASRGTSCRASRRRSGCSPRRSSWPTARVSPRTPSAADILGWRSRCYRRRRDWQAAREDVERALELAQAGGDKQATANAYFQASLVAEREGHLVLARSYAERARGLYEELADRETSAG